MTILRVWASFCALVIVGLAAAPASPAIADKRSLDMLGRIDTGRWELSMRDNAKGIERVCLQGGEMLIQLRHRDQLCEKVVIEDTPTDVTVQYTCRGHGYGRTHIRRESGRLIQIDSQGIVGGLPFDFRAEGRRVGDC